MQAENEYLEVVRKLPRPTVEQTMNFIDFLSTLHSWYKHLPYPKGFAFLFFLDPNAGRHIIYKGVKEYYSKDFWEEDMPFNEICNRTETYIKSYGYWSYHTNRDNVIWEITEENGMIGKYKHIGYNILSPQNKLIIMPDEIKALGTVEINKLIWDFRAPIDLYFYEEKSIYELEIERAELMKRIEQTMVKFLDYVYQK